MDEVNWLEQAVDILIIDDDEVDRISIRRMLKKAVFKSVVREAACGDEAMSVLSETTFDCIIMDYLMPKDNGLAVLKMIREAGIKTPVIMLTGQGHEQTAVELMKAGAADYLCKDQTLIETLSHSIVGALRIYRAEQQASRAQQQLEESRERLEQALKMATLGALAAGIAHEINQPLNSIKTTSDGMLFFYERSGRLLPEQTVVDNLVRISGQVDRIADIICQMRSIIRQEQDSELTLCNLNDVVTEVLPILNNSLFIHDIELNLSLADRLPPILARRSGLEAILVNLINNSIQAFEDVDYRKKKITCRTWVDGKVILEIGDNGCGISQQMKDRLFDPFFTKGRETGMGLGLFIVSSIVDSLNGHIAVDNSSEAGAIFRLEFPIV